MRGGMRGGMMDQGGGGWATEGRGIKDGGQEERMGSDDDGGDGGGDEDGGDGGDDDGGGGDGGDGDGGDQKAIACLSSITNTVKIFGQ